MSQPFPLLRAALLADAVASGAMGALLALGVGALAGPLGLPETLLRGAGVAFLPWAAFVGWLSTHRPPRVRLVWAAIALNAAYVLESVALLAHPQIAPTGLGVAFVLAQAAAVAILADLQFVGLRRARGTAAV